MYTLCTNFDLSIGNANTQQVIFFQIEILLCQVYIDNKYSVVYAEYLAYHIIRQGKLDIRPRIRIQLTKMPDLKTRF